MGQLRAVLFELLASGADLRSVLARLDGYATRQGASFAATVCVVLLEPSTGRLEYGSCGHPMPLVLGPDGSTRFLPGTQGGPLRSGISPQTGEAALGVRDLLLMYTDGLVERPGVTLRAGLDRLARVASAAMLNQLFPMGASASTPHRVCGQTLEVMTRTGHLDDATVLAVERREETAAPLSLQVAPDPSSLGKARKLLREWLEDLEVDAEDAMALQLATTEVMSNSIEHGYRDVTPRPIQLSVGLGPDGIARCTASDQGVWQEPTAASQDDDRQRGLALVSRLSDDLWVQHAGDGTRVTFTLRLRTRPTVASSDSPALPETAHSADDEVAFAVTELSEPSPHLRVRGPVDLSSAPDLDAALRRAARGGTISVTINLDEVTILASAGVQVLLDVSRLLGRHAQALQVVAAAGSPAYDVLAITGMSTLETHG